MAGKPDSSATNSVVLVRSWRTAFLTLRDETSSHTTDTLASVVPLLDELVFSHFQSFVAAAPLLPPREVTSDLMYLLNLAASSYCTNEDTLHALSLICHLVHNVNLCGSLELSSSAWSEILGSFCKLAKVFIKNVGNNQIFSENSLAIKATIECLETTRYLINVDPRRTSTSENVQLVEFLLHIVVCCHSELNGSYHSSGDSVKSFTQRTSLWKIQTTAFSMVGEAFERVGSSFPIETWQSVVEVLRKVMDAISTRTFPIQDGDLSRFYTSALHCLHITVTNRKGSLSEHLAAFVAVLRMFLAYGLNNSSLLSCHGDRIASPSTHGLSSRESLKKDVGAYRPPHLRRKKSSCARQTPSRTSQTPLDYDSSPVEFSSSDSDYSDSDGALKDFDSVHICKTRVAAIACIQDLCEADPKAFISQWTMLLPTNDVLQPRRFEATLMTCLLFDPFLKVRLASASTIGAMLDGPASAALQVAEYRGSSKCGSYMPLSSSLGQILMQVHAGVLYLIQRERHTGLLTSLFKILMLLISSTPYSRLPGELLPGVLTSLRLRIEEGFPFKNDQTSFLTIAIGCLTAAVSIKPSSLHVDKMFQDEISAGLFMGKGGSGVLITLFHHAEQVTNSTICLEALQALRALCHNYPNIVPACWEQISTLVYKFLRPDTFGFPSGRRPMGHDIAAVKKLVSASVKVLDECLRAISGFKGTEDLFGDSLLESPFALEYVRDKIISSAPSYGPNTLGVSKDNLSGSAVWSEAIERHIALSICQASGMVRAASITCFAGITCTVFFSLEKQQQQFILSSCIDGAYDSVPLVRSAACRAIGVIACFPEILRSVEILRKFVSAVETNTRDQPVLVRITASWAMANICDSFGHGVSDFSLDLEANFQLMMFLLECALLLTRDGDKVKSNAVRALGNLSRVIPFAYPLKQGDRAVTCTGACKKFSCKSFAVECLTQSSDILGCMHLLERIVQAFLSCITTGNVKVQWNVCHALSNLFLNETLRMQQMDWASSIFSILLLLLRDSSNFKIRIQAAAALAVPSTLNDYGSSFSDVVQGIEYNLEIVMADQNSAPSFKYRIALEKQLTASMLHILGLCSSSCHESLKEFLVKKSSFFESWLKDLCSSLDTSTHQGNGVDSYRDQKRDLLSKAIQSLSEVLKSKNQSSSVQKLQKMLAVCG